MSIFFTLWGHFVLLILTFDGSYTKPFKAKNKAVISRVPFFPYSDTFPIDLRPVAACGAAIFIDDNAKDGSKLIAIGGKKFPPYCPDYSSDFTSAHAEYEGLILGLNWILEILKRNDAEMIKTLFSSAGLIIKGDCKTVITQLNGESLPRKLSKKYREANNLLHDVKKYLYNFYQNDFKVSIQLIGREENKIADAIARIVSYTMQRRVLQKIKLCLQNNNDHTIVYKLHSNENKRKKQLPGLDSSPFASTLDLIMSHLGSVLSHTQRIAFLHLVANQAELIQDAVALAAVGGAMKIEASRLPSVFSSSKPSTIENTLKEGMTKKDELKLRGIQLEIKAMQIMGLFKDATLFEKKHQYRMKLLPEKKLSEPNSDYLLALDSDKLISESYATLFDEDATKLLQEWEICIYNSNGNTEWIDCICAKDN